MNNKCFIDSNILIYSATNEQHKSLIARQLLTNHNIVISTQVLNEFCNVVLKKKIMTAEQAGFAVSVFLNDFEVIEVNSELILKGLTIKNRYQYSYWDSLIVAAALKSGVRILYSEDMAHGQTIDNQLTIINPFNKPAF